jgi:predicted nucleic acid-binding Zn ribbon protein
MNKIIAIDNVLKLPIVWHYSVRRDRYTVLTKSTHAMKRASHVGCNACNVRIQRVLHRICYSNVAHMKRVYIAFATRMSRI